MIRKYISSKELWRSEYISFHILFLFCHTISRSRISGVWSFLILGEDRLLRYSELHRHLRYMHIDLDLRLYRHEKWETLLYELLLTDDALYIILSSSLSKIESYRRKWGIFQTREITSGFDEVIWIFAIWDRYNTHFDILIRESINRGKCRFHSRSVWVKTEIDRTSESLEYLDVFESESCTTDSYSIIDICLMKCDGIHLSFDDIDFTWLRYDLLREMESIEDRALIEDTRCRRV